MIMERLTYYPFSVKNQVKKNKKKLGKQLGRTYLARPPLAVEGQQQEAQQAEPSHRHQAVFRFQLREGRAAHQVQVDVVQLEFRAHLQWVAIRFDLIPFVVGILEPWPYTLRLSQSSPSF